MQQPWGSTKTKPDGNGAGLKEEGEGIISEIGAVITATAGNGSAYFTEAEKNDTRQIIKSTQLNERGIEDLRSFKVFLADELEKRKLPKAA